MAKYECDGCGAPVEADGSQTLILCEKCYFQVPESGVYCAVEIGTDGILAKDYEYRMYLNGTLLYVANTLSSSWDTATRLATRDRKHLEEMLQHGVTQVVNIKSEGCDVYIGRKKKGQDGYFGNPFHLAVDTPEERAKVLVQYKAYFWKRVNEDLEFRHKVMALKGQRLGCYCKPKACHGDIIKAWLDAGCPLKPWKVMHSYDNRHWHEIGRFSNDQDKMPVYEAVDKLPGFLAVYEGDRLHFGRATAVSVKKASDDCHTFS